LSLYTFSPSKLFILIYSPNLPILGKNIANLCQDFIDKPFCSETNAHLKNKKLRIIVVNVLKTFVFKNLRIFVRKILGNWHLR